MDVVLLGAFKIADTGELGARIDSSGASAPGLVYDGHISQMAALGPQVAVASIDTPWGSMQLLEGQTDFATVRIRVTVADRDALHALEPQVEKVANELIASRHGTPPATTPKVRCYPVGVVLWWHRLLINPGSDEPRAIRLFGERFSATDTDEGCVADGFSSIGADDARVVEEVASGITAATEDWLLIDDLSRRLVNALLMTKDDEEVLGQALVVAEQLTEEVALAVLLLDERRRHLANATMRTHRAATSVWGLAEVRESLLRNAESVQSLIRVEHGRRNARADARRNDILFGFTAVTVLQSILLIIDFASADPIGIGSSLRAAIAAVVLVLTVGILLRFMLTRHALDTPPVEPLAVARPRIRRGP